MVAVDKIAACKNCGIVLEVVSKRGRRRQYCSQRCSDLWRYQNRESNINKICEHCEGHFMTWNALQRFCSSSCAASKHMARVRLSEKNCVVCNAKFKPSKSAQECCSIKCGRTLSTLKNIEVKRSYYSCAGCGETFTRRKDSGRGDPRYCTHDCYLRYMHGMIRDNIRGEQELRNVRSIDRRYKRRAEKFGVYYEFINVVEIFERDHWECQICGMHVDSLIRWTHQLSASLDHTIPLSQGGAHEPNNVQLAHYICNVRKGGETDQTVTLPRQGGINPLSSLIQ